MAVTPNLTVELLFQGYAQGYFPWSGRPARWYCPDPRAIFEMEEVHFSRRLLRTIRQEKFEVTFDKAFRRVIEACSAFHESCWIDDEIVNKYVEFHRAGFAHSVEVWEERELVGGLYGVHLRRMFAGESMFHHRRDASKVGFYHLVQKLKSMNVSLFDAQVLNPHTESLGASEISRSDFLRRLQDAVGFEEAWTQDW